MGALAPTLALLRTVLQVRRRYLRRSGNHDVGLSLAGVNAEHYQVLDSGMRS